MLNQQEIIQTISMIKDQHLDIRTVTMHLSLFDCISDDPKKTAANVRRKLLAKAGNLKAWWKGYSPSTAFPSSTNACP